MLAMRGGFRAAAALGAMMALGVAGATARAATMGPWDIPWYTMDAGAQTSAGGGWEVTGTIGQADSESAAAGPVFSAAPQISLSGGYWEGGVRVCRGDFNADGNLNPDDLGDFITMYFEYDQYTNTGDPRSDYNIDANVNPDDLGDFITEYFVGCDFFPYY